MDELAVGDVILIEAGSRVPADCVLFDSADVSVNEGVYRDEEVFLVKKYNLDDPEFSSPDCFLLSDSYVMEGYGKAVVCAVGARSRKGLNEEKEFASPDVFTPLKERLENLAN